MLTQSASFTSTPAVALAARPTARAAPVRVGARADGAFIGSATNIIMVTSTTLVLAAGRFGLAPSSKRLASASETPLRAGARHGSLAALRRRGRRWSRGTCAAAIGPAWSSRLAVTVSDKTVPRTILRLLAPLTLRALQA